MRENRTYGLKRRGLETERKPPRQSPTLLAQLFWRQVFRTSWEVLVGHSAGDQGV